MGALIAAIVAAVVASVAATVSAVQSEKSRQAQVTAGAREARFKRTAIAAEFSQKEQAAAQRKLELSRMALAARGRVQAENLGDRSVRALGRAIGFELGQDKATITKNQEIAQREAGARLMGIDLQRAQQVQQIGNHNGLQMGLEIGGAWLLGGADLTSKTSDMSKSDTGSEQLMATSENDTTTPAFNDNIA